MTTTSITIHIHDVPTHNIMLFIGFISIRIIGVHFRKSSARVSCYLLLLFDSVTFFFSFFISGGGGGI